MRGIFASILLGLILLAGCAQQSGTENVTNTTNTSVSNPPPVEVCSGTVCGSDGQTYNSDCEAELANVSVAYEGECVVENCTETDGGINVSVAGSVTKGNTTLDDYCIDESQLVEYTCLDNSIQLSTIQCGAGKECADGRCAPVQAPPENQTQNASVSGCVGPSAADIYASESASYNGSTYNDSCVEYTVVKDYFCKDNALQTINHQCPPGYGCTLGQCVQLKLLCNDDDGGNNTAVKGRTIVTKGIYTIFDETDKCVDDGKLKEGICLENNSAVYDEVLCASGTKCVNGRCVDSLCSESDGGNNIYKAGQTSTANDENDYFDYCVDDYTIHEYYCYGDEVNEDVVNCGAGYICNPDTDSCVQGSKS
jgi:hypothetical protein